MRRRGRAPNPLGRKLLAWGALLFVGTTLARALIGEKGLVEVWRHRREASAIERQIRQLRADNDRMRTEIRALRGDPRSIEPIAREELGFAGKEEILILFPRRERPRTETRAGVAAPPRAGD